MYKDRFFWVRELIDGFNENMRKAFVSSWIVCVDESMVVFYNKYAPGWIAVKRKPHPLGNEYHTTACCESKVIFWIEIVEGRSKPKEGPNAESKFEKEFESKIAALVVRMTTPIWGSGKVVIMDSGFGYVPSVVQLKEKGLYATTVSIDPISLHKTAEPSARKIFLLVGCMFLQSLLKGVMWVDAPLSMTQPFSRSEAGR